MLTWFDLQGNPAGTLGDPGDYALPAVSPDGSRVAVAMGTPPSRDIWILDVARGASTRFTFDPADDTSPAWSPDGKTIAFSSNRAGQMDIYAKPSDGSGEEKLLLKTGESKTVEHWTKDGRFLLFSSVAPKTADDMWALPVPVSGEPKPIPLLQTEFREGLSEASPDGRWLAYISTEASPTDVYVRPFTPEAPAGTGAKWLVSKGGGIRPLWRPDGKVLYYITLGSEYDGCGHRHGQGLSGRDSATHVHRSAGGSGDHRLGPVARWQALPVRRAAEHRPRHPVYRGPQLGRWFEKVGLKK